MLTITVQDVDMITGGSFCLEDLLKNANLKKGKRKKIRGLRTIV